MFISYLALFVAVLISAVSAYFSISGLTNIFVTAFYPIIVMGTALEIGKLVSASILYRNWQKLSIWLKGYLFLAITVLMFISSLGIFGYLSRAHLEQGDNNSANIVQLEKIESKIRDNNNRIDDLNKQIQQIDTAVDKLTQNGRVQGAISLVNTQKQNRISLTKAKESIINDNSILEINKIELSSKAKKIEAEVGPLKYVAALVYDKNDADQIEKAVRFIIILIVAVFDPLAMVLLIAANNGLKTTKNYNALEIHKDVI